MPTYPLTYLVCPDCEQIHYFRAVTIKDNTLIRYNHPQDPDDPTQFKTDCQTCLHMQENDPPTLTRALDRTRTDPLHAEAMISVDEFTKTDLVIAVLACPQCTETSLFNTNWKGELTAFSSFGMDQAAESLHQRLHRIQAPDGRQPRLQLLRKAQEQRSRGDRRGRRIHQRELPRSFSAPPAGRSQRTSHRCNLRSRPIARTLPRGRTHLDELCQKTTTSAVSSRTTPGAGGPKVAEL